MNYFEKLLEEKCKEEERQDYQIQWGYDKKLYSSILSAVNESYPNYTDHGKSHSDSILNNILKMFGEEALKKLSSLDTWLLLEAAYLHDCGMFISLKRYQEILKEEKFKTFIKNIQYDLRNPLYDYAIQFNVENEEIKYNNSNYDPKKDLAMKYLIATYKRGNHAFELDETTKKRGDKLLPIRLYKILDLICESHCWEFEKLKNLPQKESGIINEIGHPRFISYLLRIGDLLDIDNNRMDYIQTRDLEKYIPKDSKLHLDKHLSIVHYRVDMEKIEISALIDCGLESYEVAEITNLWFECLQKEYTNQLHNWKEIIPNNFNGTLPTLGKLKVEIQNYEYTDSRDKTKFSINLEDISDLLMGESIYKTKEIAIRELIQNAIDATYIRVFEEKKGTNQLTEILTQTKKNEFFKEKEIEISINKNPDKSTHSVNCWEISIKDNGIGINRDTLKYILDTGSSQKNYNKKNIIEKMPYWLQPSGNFGIGFQSVFMLTKEVYINSKSLYTNEEIEVTLFKPSEKNRIYFKKTKFDYTKKIGTEIKFDYHTKKVSTSFKNDENFIRKLSREFDGLVNKEFDTEIMGVLDMINKINTYSLINIKVKKDGEYLVLGEKYLSDIPCSSDEKFEIKLIDNPMNFDRASGNSIYFRNQFIENNKYLGLKYLNFIINIIGFKAKDIVVISRSNLKEEYYNKIESELLTSIFRYILNNYLLKESIEDLNNKILIFYLYYQNEFDKLEKRIDSEKINRIKNKIFDIKINQIISINDILKNKEFEIREVDRNLGQMLVQITPDNELFGKNQFEFILFLILKERKYSLEIIEKNKIKLIESVDEGINIRYTEQIIEVLQTWETSVFFTNLGRFFLCYDKTYPKLRLKENMEKTEIEKWIYKNFLTLSYFNFVHEMDNFIRRNLVLCPFFIKTKDVLVYNQLIREKYVKFCYKNRLDINTTEEEIRIELDKLVEELRKFFKTKEVEITTQ